jgi:hypothetical protein
MARSSSGESADLIRRRQVVQVHPGQLAGSSVVRAPSLYLGNQSPVQFRPGLPNAGSVGGTDNSPDPQSGECRFEPGTEHGPIVYRLRSRTFTSGNGVRLPVGLLRGSQVRYGAGPITQRCAGSNPVPATKIVEFRCRLMAGPVAVNHVIAVRIRSPEPWLCGADG